MEEKRAYLKLPIEDCFKTFDQSFNRVKYFSCLANHLSFEGFPKEWGIQNSSGLSYVVKAPATEKEKQNILEGYKHFIHCYLLRDCIESFAISLDNLFFMLLLSGKNSFSSQVLHDALSKNEKALLVKFQRAGLYSKEGKTQLLKEHFDLEIDNNNQTTIASLKDIRNCLSHSNGFVRSTDGEGDGQKARKFTWKVISLFIKDEKTGKKN